tara:strand:- start:364 stop:1116 length:753 start_codon:yes stop_codon:yes gene_type:complete
MSQAHAYTNTHDIIAPILARHSMFENVPAETVTLFADKAKLKPATKSKVLFLRDDPAEWFYVVRYGWVKLFRETLEGTEAVVDVLPSGHMFGENSVFENDQYSYSAEVIEASELIMLPTELLKQTIADNQTVALNMLASMARHHRQQSREIEHLNIQNAPQRIGCFLLRLCPQETVRSVTLHLPYDKTLIAARLGMKPETFSRALNKLKQETPVTINGPTVEIHDIEKLVNYTCNHCSDSFPCEDLNLKR